MKPENLLEGQDEEKKLNLRFTIHALWYNFRFKS